MNVQWLIHKSIHVVEFIHKIVMKYMYIQSHENK